jgi:hypothetical protein
VGAIGDDQHIDVGLRIHAGQLIQYDFQSALFARLAHHGFGYRLAGFDIAGRWRPIAGEGRIPATDQHQLVFMLDHGHAHRRRVAIGDEAAVRALFALSRFDRGQNQARTALAAMSCGHSIPIRRFS